MVTDRHSAVETVDDRCCWAPRTGCAYPPSDSSRGRPGLSSGPEPCGPPRLRRWSTWPGLRRGCWSTPAAGLAPSWRRPGSPVGRRWAVTSRSRRCGVRWPTPALPSPWWTGAGFPWVTTPCRRWSPICPSAGTTGSMASPSNRRVLAEAHPGRPDRTRPGSPQSALPTGARAPARGPAVAPRRRPPRAPDQPLDVGPTAPLTADQEPASRRCRRHGRRHPGSPGRLRRSAGQ